MKLLSRDILDDTLDFFDLPPYLEKAVRWVQRHPRTVLTGALVLVMAVMLVRTPTEPPAEPDAYSDGTPLFI